MLETTISGLIIAGASGLTFVAYKHPAAFRRIQGVLENLNYIVVGLLGAYYVGFTRGQIAESPDETALPFSFFWVFLSFLAVQLYLLFLQFLPRVLAVDHESNPDDKLS